MSSVEEPTYWSLRYQQGQTGWDMGGPTPVFVHLLRENRLPVLPGATVLVPGCGYGHDVLLLAKAGYRVLAVDFAPEPLAVLHARARELPVTIYQANYFDLPAQLGSSIDMILEYTCFCAIDPGRRQAYFETAFSLLRAGGWLVGLFFPIQPKGTPLQGPPFPVSEEELFKLATAAGFAIRYRETPTTSHPARLGREQLWLLWKAVS